MDGEELLVVGVAGQPHRQDVQVGLTDPRHLEMNNDLDKFMAAGVARGRKEGMNVTKQHQKIFFTSTELLPNQAL